MLEVRDIHLPLSASVADAPEKAIARALKKKLGRDVIDVRVLKRSVDARKGHPIQFVYAAAFSCDAEDELLSEHKTSLKRYQRQWPHIASASFVEPPPVIVGAGCAGIFLALYLAEAGLKPLLVEQGDRPSKRAEIIQNFFKTKELNLQTNIQFGCGGAGAFSDGKLQTGTKSPYHQYILEKLVEVGAPKDILIDAKPHIGSDLLPKIIERLLKTIEALGGLVITSSKVVDITFENVWAKAVTIQTAHGVFEKRLTSALFLCCGHSARDIYRLLLQKHVQLEPKTYAMGYRIEHLQEEVNKAVWRAEAENPLLGPATYKVAVHTSGARSVFSFCMCPGGVVVPAASEYESVVTNGASDSQRAQKNANAALLVNVYPEDWGASGVLAGIEMQIAAEKSAYTWAGGAYKAPAQLVGDYLAHTGSTGPKTVLPSYPLGVSYQDLHGIYPEFIDEALHEAFPKLAKRYRFFDNPDAILTAPETRSSSPVRITRDEQFRAIGYINLYPVGEGAGYAGGIMSAAADGMRVAHAFCEQTRTSGA